MGNREYERQRERHRTKDKEMRLASAASASITGVLSCRNCIINTSLIDQSTRRIQFYQSASADRRAPCSSVANWPLWEVHCTGTQFTVQLTDRLSIRLPGNWSKQSTLWYRGGLAFTRGLEPACGVVTSMQVSKPHTPTCYIHRVRKKRDQNVFCNISYKTPAIVMKFCT